MINRTTIVRTSPAGDPADLRPAVDFPTTALALSYPYLGHRDYIQGVAVLHGMIQCAEAFSPGLAERPGFIRQAKIFREITTESWAETMRREDALKHPLRSAALARLDLDCGDEPLTALLFPLADRPVTKRLAKYPFGDYREHVFLEDGGRTRGTMRPMRDVIELLCGVEECFRDLVILESGLPRHKLVVRWAYVEHFPFRQSDWISRIDTVVFGPSQKLPDKRGCFDIREGTFPGTKPEEAFSMCFHVSAASDEG